MDLIDGRGSHGKKVKQHNINKIRKFFSKNPGSTKMDCKHATGLSYITILKLIKEIQESDNE